MQKDAEPSKRSARYDGDRTIKSSYNPFRKLTTRRTKYLFSQHDEGSYDKTSSPPPIAKVFTGEDTPYIVGELFSPVDLQPDSAGTIDSCSENPLPKGRVAGQIDEEKSSISSSDTDTSPVIMWILSWLNRLCEYFLIRNGAQPQSFYDGQSGQKFSAGNRKRRVIVVEYGNTDNITEGTSDGQPRAGNVADPLLVTAETVRQSWNNPIYSEIAAPGYPIDEKGHRRSRKSWALGKPLKESLRKVCVFLCTLCSWILILSVHTPKGASELEIVVSQRRMRLPKSFLKVCLVLFKMIEKHFCRLGMHFI